MFYFSHGCHIVASQLCPGSGAGKGCKACPNLRVRGRVGSHLRKSWKIGVMPTFSTWPVISLPFFFFLEWIRYLTNARCAVLSRHVMMYFFIPLSQFWSNISFLSAARWQTSPVQVFILSCPCRWSVLGLQGGWRAPRIPTASARIWTRGACAQDRHGNLVGAKRIHILLLWRQVHLLE